VHVRIFKTRWLVRYARRERIADAMLRDAVARAKNGVVDADLGGGVIKQRVARPGKGKSGGYRTLIAFRRGQRAIFVFAFAKNERDNISDAELTELRKQAAKWLVADDMRIGIALDVGELQEI
jgi:hypothetical protein